MIFRLDDIEKGLRILKANGIDVIAGERIDSI
jgi:hypothetical protein